MPAAVDQFKNSKDMSGNTVAGIAIVGYFIIMGLLIMSGTDDPVTETVITIERNEWGERVQSQRQRGDWGQDWDHQRQAN